MPLTKLIFQPGINKDKTNYSQEGGWFAGDKIRFRQGFPEKIGGWEVQNFNQYKMDQRRTNNQRIPMGVPHGFCAHRTL